MTAFTFTFVVYSANNSQKRLEIWLSLSITEYREEGLKSIIIKKVLDTSLKVFIDVNL